MVRVEVVETSSQVWKTCILTAVLHSQALLLFRARRLVFSPSETRLFGERTRKNAKIHVLNGVGYRDRTDDLLDHNQTL